jgi:hypothetical protein
MEKRAFLYKVRKFFKWWVVVIILVLIIARIMLPYFVLKYVNRQLHEMNGYDGHVDDIDIRLIRGAYVIKDIKIWELNNEIYSKDSFPFFSAHKIDLSVEWKSLFKGHLVGKVRMDEPLINLKKKKADTTTNVKADTSDFRSLVRNIMPLKINSLRLVNGQIHYVDLYSMPQVNIMMHDINSTALNLTNAESKDTLLPSSITGNGEIYEGSFNFNVHLDLLNKQPTFYMNAALMDMQLPEANNFFEAYANVDVSRGTFGVYTEFAAKDGKFDGYVKPILKDMHITQYKSGVGPKLWEMIVASVAFVITNHIKDQLATKVQIQGDFNKPNIGTWSAIKYVLLNAYIQALQPSIDHTISINNVGAEKPKESLFRKIFPKKNP